MNSEFCVNCRYSVKILYATVRCRRHAPAHQGRNGYEEEKDQHAFPGMPTEGWCGDWKARLVAEDSIKALGWVNEIPQAP